MTCDVVLHTRVRAALDKEAAKILLGHVSTDTTDIYLLDKVQEAIKMTKQLEVIDKGPWCHRGVNPSKAGPARISNGSEAAHGWQESCPRLAGKMPRAAGFEPATS